MRYEIKSRWGGTVLFSIETKSFKLAVEAGVKGDADLRGADLTSVRDDLWAVLSSAPAEVEGLRAALMDGRVDGSTYEGDCACLVGTLANVRHCKYDQIQGLAPNSSRPAEVFFAAIRKGDVPVKSQHATLALEWIDTWLANMRAAFAVVES